jgi:hypothetical protein
MAAEDYRGGMAAHDSATVGGEVTRQPAEVVAQRQDALDAARETRDAAQLDVQTATGLLARAFVDGLTRDDVPDWVQRYHDAEAAAERASATWWTARIEWYHAFGRHASTNLTNCCQPSTPDERSHP